MVRISPRKLNLVAELIRVAYDSKAGR